MKHVLFILTFATFLAGSCKPADVPAPLGFDSATDASAAPDAEPVVGDAALSSDDALAAKKHPECQKVFCAKLAQLGCPESLSVPGGLSCISLCSKILDDRKFDLQLACVGVAKDIPSVRKCRIACSQ